MKNSMELFIAVIMSALYCCASVMPYEPLFVENRLRSLASQRFPLLVLNLRGGDGRIVPGISWSQQADSVLIKVDMPQGIHSSDGLKISDSHITWKEGDVDLDLALSAEVKSQSATIFCDGCVGINH